MHDEDNQYQEMTSYPKEHMIKQIEVLCLYGIWKWEQEGSGGALH